MWRGRERRSSGSEPPRSVGGPQRPPCNTPGWTQTCPPAGAAPAQGPDGERGWAQPGGGLLGTGPRSQTRVSTQPGPGRMRAPSTGGITGHSSEGGCARLVLTGSCRQPLLTWGHFPGDPGGPWLVRVGLVSPLCTDGRPPGSHGWHRAG